MAPLLQVSRPFLGTPPPVFANTLVETYEAYGADYYWLMREEVGDFNAEVGNVTLQLGTSSAGAGRAGTRNRIGPIRGAPYIPGYYTTIDDSSIPRSASPLWQTGDTEGSLHIWMYVDGSFTSTWRRVLWASNNTNNTSVGFSVEVSNSREIRAYVSAGTRNYTATSSASVFNFKEWFTLGVTQRADGTGFHIFVNGAELSTSTTLSGGANVNDFVSVVGTMSGVEFLGLRPGTRTDHYGLAMSAPAVFRSGAADQFFVDAFENSQTVAEEVVWDERVQSVFGDVPYAYVPGSGEDYFLNGMPNLGRHRRQSSVWSAGTFGASNGINVTSGGIASPYNQRARTWGLAGSTNSAVAASFSRLPLSASTGTVLIIVTTREDSFDQDRKLFSFGGNAGSNFDEIGIFMRSVDRTLLWGARTNLFSNRALRRLLVPLPESGAHLIAIVQDGTKVVIGIDGVLYTDPSDYAEFISGSRTLGDWFGTPIGSKSSTNIGSNAGSSSSENLMRGQVGDVIIEEGVTINADQFRDLYNSLVGGFKNVLVNYLSQLGATCVWRFDDGIYGPFVSSPGGMSLEPVGADGDVAGLLPGPCRGKDFLYAVARNEESGGVLQATTGAPSWGASTGAIGGCFKVVDNGSDMTAFRMTGLLGDVRIVFTSTTRDIRVEVRRDGSNNYALSTNTGDAWEFNEWLFVVCVQRADGTGLHIFVNGREITTTTGSPVGTATVDSWTDYLGSASGAYLLEGSGAPGAVNSGFAASVPFFFDGSAPTDAQIVQLKEYCQFNLNGITLADKALRWVGSPDYWLTASSVQENSGAYLPPLFRSAGNDRRVQEVSMTSAMRNQPATGVPSLGSTVCWDTRTGDAILRSAAGASFTTASTGIVLVTFSPGSVSGRRTLWSIGDASTSPGPCYLEVGTEGAQAVMRFQAPNGDFFQRVWSGITLVADEWYTAVFMQTGAAGARCFIQGQQLTQVSDTSSGTTFNSQSWTADVAAAAGGSLADFQIGARVGEIATTNFRGRIADVLEWDNEVANGEFNRAIGLAGFLEEVP